MEIVLDCILVGGFKHEWIIFHHIWDVILPIDELIFFSRWLKPPTSQCLDILILRLVPTNSFNNRKIPAAERFSLGTTRALAVSPVVIVLTNPSMTILSNFSFRHTH